MRGDAAEPVPAQAQLLEQDAAVRPNSPLQLMSLVVQRPQRSASVLTLPPTARGDRYNIAKNGDNFAGVTAQTFTDYTAEFLLTRGPYAILGYSW